MQDNVGGEMYCELIKVDPRMNIPGPLLQMFEADGSLMLYWYGLADVNAEDGMNAFIKSILRI